MKLSYDVNGNKVLKIEKSDTLNGQRGFSVQTLGNLPLTHRDGVNNHTLLELKIYLLSYGTKIQRDKMCLDIYRHEYMKSNSALKSVGIDLHHIYYMQFVTTETKYFITTKIGIDKLKTSKCEHLNDLYKHSNNGAGTWIWDHTPIHGLKTKNLGDCNSLATHTCVGKAYAKRLLGYTGIIK